MSERYLPTHQWVDSAPGVSRVGRRSRSARNPGFRMRRRSRIGAGLCQGSGLVRPSRNPPHRRGTLGPGGTGCSCATAYMYRRRRWWWWWRWRRGAPSRRMRGIGRCSGGDPWVAWLRTEAAAQCSRGNAQVCRADQLVRPLAAEHRAPPLGVIVFFLQIDTLTQKNSSRDKHLQNPLLRPPRAFGAD